MLRSMRNDAVLWHEGSDQLSRLFLDLAANPNAACWSVRASGMPWSRSLIARGRGGRPSTMASSGAPRAPSCLGTGRRGLSLLRPLHDGVSCARRTSRCAWRCASPSRAGAALSPARSAAKDHAAEAAISSAGSNVGGVRPSLIRRDGSEWSSSTIATARLVASVEAPVATRVDGDRERAGYKRQHDAVKRRPARRRAGQSSTPHSLG